MTRHLLVIGAQRCGTTYLQKVLDAHPDIAMAKPARPEPKVFLSEADAARGVGWYRSQYFSHAGTECVLGEKSTSYLEHPDAAPRAARVLGADAHILVVLRDPVARAVSNWRFSSANRLEERPLERALADNLEVSRPWDPRATSVSPYAYLERGCYSAYLDAWCTSFPDTVHVCFFEELAGRPEAVADVYRTLGVDPGFRPSDLDQPANQSEGPTPVLDAHLENRLRKYFAAPDAALRQRLGRDLPWPTA